jgi:nitroimidazol reductase NimA-like FMN-containing flavoprotein (pyridoxamine 5'-phosphate oxidase superfamily)
MEDLTAEQCLKVLEEGTVAHLAVVSDGEPYVTPLSYVIIDGDLLFRTVPGRRIDALAADPHVCVEVTTTKEDGGWESIVFWGEARFVEDDRIHADVVAALLAKYHTESALGFSSPSVFPEERTLVAITPERMTGRASGEGFSAPTRPGRL